MPHFSFDYFDIGTKVWVVTSVSLQPVEATVESVSVYIDWRGTQIRYGLKSDGGRYLDDRPEGVFASFDEAETESKVRIERYRES